MTDDSVRKMVVTQFEKACRKHFGRALGKREDLLPRCSGFFKFWYRMGRKKLKFMLLDDAIEVTVYASRLSEQLVVSLVEAEAGFQVAEFIGKRFTCFFSPYWMAPDSVPVPKKW